MTHRSWGIPPRPVDTPDAYDVPGVGQPPREPGPAMACALMIGMGIVGALVVGALTWLFTIGANA